MSHVRHADRRRGEVAALEPGHRPHLRLRAPSPAPACSKYRDQVLRRQAAVDLELGVRGRPGPLDHRRRDVGADDLRGRRRASREPVEQQHRQRVGLLAAGAGRRPDASARAGPAPDQLGQQVLRRAPGTGGVSRNHEVSFVVMASTTSVGERASPRRSRATSASTSRSPTVAGERRQPGLDEVLLAGLQVDGAALAHELGDEGEVGRGQGHRGHRPPRRPRRDERGSRARGRSCGSGRTAVGQPGAGDGAGHAPDHAGRLVLGDDLAAGVPDRRRSRARRPGPCRSARRASTRRRRRAATERNRTSTAGRQKFSGGSSVSSRDDRVPRRSHRRGGGRRGRRAPGRARAASPSAASATLERRWPSSRCREQPGEDRRHVLDDDDGHRQVGGQRREHGGERVGAAGGAADGERRRRAPVRGTAADGRARRRRTAAPSAATARRAGPVQRLELRDQLLADVAAGDSATLPTFDGFVT